MNDEARQVPPEILRITPPIGLPGGEVTLHCVGLDPLALDDESLYFCDSLAMIESASAQKLVTRVPDSVCDADASHEVFITQNEAQSNLYHFIVPECLANALHNVSSPVVAPDNTILAPFCGIQGQIAPVSIYLVSERFSFADQSDKKAPFVCGLDNIGALAVNPRGEIFAASRSTGMVYAIERDGGFRVFTEGFENPCSLAAASDGTLYLAEGSGRLFSLDASGRAAPYAEVQASDICVHLALDPEDRLFASSTQNIGENTLWRIVQGQAEALLCEMAEYRGIAFDRAGVLYLALTEHGSGGIDRFDKGKRHRIVSGQDIAGLAFSANNDMYIATHSKIYLVKNRRLMVAQNALE